MRKIDSSEAMSGPNITLLRHDTAAAFTAAVTARLAAQLRSGLAARDAASLIVPGGTTPAPIFEALAKEEIAWDKVTVSLSDERWVPATDPASNEGLVRRHLLTGRAQATRLIGLYDGTDAPSAGLASATTRLQAMPMPVDAVLLGMGGDGHFASLFPGLADLAAGLDATGAASCLASDAPINGAPRLSLSLALLLQSRVLLLAVKGRDKLAVLERARTAEPLDLPIAALLRQSRVPVEIHWTEG